MTVLPERAKDVFAPFDSAGNARGMDMAQGQRWGILQERMAVYGAVSTATKLELDAIAPASGTFPGGMVLGGAEAGLYAWNGSDWGSKVRGFPDTAALLINVSGTANAIKAETQTGVDPGEVQLFILSDPPGTNTSTDMSLLLNEGGSNETTFAIKGASGASVAIGDVIGGVGAVFFKANDTEIRQLVSSQPGATLKFKGAWNAGDNYTKSDFVTRSNKLFFLTTDVSQNEDPDGGGPWLLVFDLGTVSSDVLENYAVTSANDAATNAANLTTLEAAVSKTIVDGRGQEIPVTSQPLANFYRNTVWMVPNFDGTMTAGLPSDPDLVPVVRTLVRSSGFEDGWAQVGVHIPSGTDQAVSAYTTKKEHGNVPTTICMRYGTVSTDTINWKRGLPLLGPGQKLNPADGAESVSAYGYDCYSFFMIGDAVAFFQVAKKYDGTFITWHMMRKHIGKIYAGTIDMIQTTTGSEDIRIAFADLNVSCFEGQYIELESAPLVNGVNVNRTWFVQQRNSQDMVLRKVTLNADTADADGPGVGGGTFRMRVRATDLEELKFAGGENLGEAYMTFSGLPAIPSVFHGGKQITTGGNGQAIVGVTGGSPSPGHAVIQGLLDSQASFLSVVKYTDADVETDHTEPAPIVDPATGKVYTILRVNDESKPSLLCVGADVSSQPVCTPLPFSGTAEESPWFLELVETGSGKMLFGVFSGDRTPIDESYGVLDEIPMFVISAPIADVDASNVAAFKSTWIGNARWSGELPNQAALMQMGGLTYSQKLNALVTQFSEADPVNSADYASSMNSMLIGLDFWNPKPRREPLRQGHAEGVYDYWFEYFGVGAALNAGDPFVPQTLVHDPVSDSFDLVDGWISSRRDCEVTIGAVVYYDDNLTGSGNENYLAIEDEDGNDPRGASVKRICFHRAGSSGQRTEVREEVSFYITGGKKFRVVVASGKVQVGVGRNSIRVSFS